MNKQQHELNRRLKPRHMMMIAIGGTIGSGIFNGSSTAITLAGPSVVIAYLLGGLILLFVMRSLADIAMKNPQAKTLRDLITPILGPFVGHTFGWIAWLDWVLVTAAEITAAGIFLQYWFLHTPLWLLSFIASIVLTLVNLLHVNIYGETEYWFSSVKLTVLVLFVVLGGIFIFSGYGQHPPTGLHNMLNHGGFFPHGLSGFAAAMLVVMFSFGGIEMIGMTLGETLHHEKTILRAANSVIIRILAFYILPIAVIINLTPWDHVSIKVSPFVSVFSSVGVPYVGSIMNFVMLTAVLSAANTGLYSTSRMIYAQALDGKAPRIFATLSRRGVPVRALMFSILFLYVGVVIAFFAKGNTFNDLMVIPGYSVLIIWTLLVVARIKSNGLTICRCLTLTALLVILIGIVVTTSITGTLITLGAILLTMVTYPLTKISARRHLAPTVN